mgnify:CR=1 FL=1
MTEQLMENIRELVRSESKDKTNWDIDFSGSFFSNQQMLNELVVILFISILLMYFILAAQFESFLQPLIVLLDSGYYRRSRLLTGIMDMRAYLKPDECYRYRGNLRYHHKRLYLETGRDQ